MSTPRIDMLQGSLWNKILAFSLPLILTGIFEQLFNAADTLILGRFASAAAMAAVGNNTPLVGLIVYLFLGLSLGANVLIAQALGAGNLRAASRTVHTAIVLAFATGIAVALLGQFVTVPVMDWLGVPPDVLPLTTIYFRLFLLGMPFLCLYNFISAILRSRGDTRTPFYALFEASLLNILLDLLFVAVFGWGTAGAAIATDLSLLVCAAKLLRALLRESGILRLDPRLLRACFSPAVLRRILAIGLPSALQGMKDLEYVELFLNDITDLSPLKDKEKLVDLNIFYNPLKNGFEVLREMPQLKRLWAGKCRLSEEQLAELREALPETVIVTEGISSTGNGWRVHPHYDILKRMYQVDRYIPFDD